ncbi:MAG: DUF3160 domain-containing protein, partial [Chloroflexota bacterium]
MKRTIFLLIALLALVMPAAAQSGDNCLSTPILLPGAHGSALIDLEPYEAAGFDSAQTRQPLLQGAVFQITEGSQPLCIDGTRWLEIISMSAYGWIPETIDGEFVFEPYVFTPEAPIPFDIPLNQPVISNPDVPLPTVAPATNPTALDVPFADWDWQALMQDYYYSVPDPLAMQLPVQYAGDLPVPPVDLSTVYFVQDANLNDGQLALLAQNGFVVVPGSDQQFDDVYRDVRQSWDHQTGKAQFVTTDALLHDLFLIYQNALMFLETNVFYGDVATFLMQGYQAAESQYVEAIDTPLENNAREAAVFYAVPLMLLAEGQGFYVRGYEQTPVYTGDGELSPRSVLASANPVILAEAQPLVDLAKAGEGREFVPMLEDYEEDFSQYTPRSYYAGNPLLEAYFRAMMWLGRITFTAKSQQDTLTGLLALRALHTAPDAFARWQHVADTLDFLVGPVDDYGPNDYLPMALANNAFGSQFSLSAL